MGTDARVESAFVVRAATVADMQAAVAIYRPSVEAGTASFEVEAPDAAEMARRLTAITGAGFPYLVAEAEGGAIAGYAYANTFRTRAAFRSTAEHSVYVAADFQGQGLGKRLLMALIEAAEAAGLRQLIGVIGDPDRQTASLALHRACGFTEAGRLTSVGFKHGRWLDIVLVQRALGRD